MKYNYQEHNLIICKGSNKCPLQLHSVISNQDAQFNAHSQKPSLLIVLKILT